MIPLQVSIYITCSGPEQQLRAGLLKPVAIQLLFSMWKALQIEDSLLSALMCHSSITIAAIHQLFSRQAYLQKEDPLVGTMMYSANITIFNESN